MGDKKNREAMKKGMVDLVSKKVMNGDPLFLVAGEKNDSADLTVLTNFFHPETILVPLVDFILRRGADHNFLIGVLEGCINLVKQHDENDLNEVFEIKEDEDPSEIMKAQEEKAKHVPDMYVVNTNTKNEA